ncbi:MAG: RNA degradosome polyphosphate kinase, partial [Octadecabacter sp.]
MTLADFLKADFPEPHAVEGDMDGPARFFNRELSWLGFNWRVLEEAENPKVPLLERLRFLSISATNLDEFYTVRVAGLRELAHAGNTTPSMDGLTPAQQLSLIDENTRNLLANQQRVLADLRLEMLDEDITILSRDDLTDDDRIFLKDAFFRKVFPVLSPLAIDPAHPFPFLPNEGFALALELERTKDKRALRALLPVPAQV